MSENYREALVQKRAEILTAGGVRPLAATMENNSRQGDMADQADGNNEVHIQLKLKQTDAKILQAIEEALGKRSSRKFKPEHRRSGVSTQQQQQLGES